MSDIVFSCPHCLHSLSVEENGAGQVVDCPECRGKIRIPKRPYEKGSGAQSIPSKIGPPKMPNQRLSAARSFSPLVMLLLVTVGVLAIWAVTATLIASANGESLARLRAEINAVRSEAETIRKQANDNIAAAEAKRKEAEGFVLREQQELQRIYPGLTKYRPGRNEVNKRYLDAFEVSRNTIKTFMTNRGTRSTSPHFTIVFLTKYGFITRSLTKYWWIDSIGPGETRVDDDGSEFEFGEPVYYTIHFKD